MENGDWVKVPYVYHKPNPQKTLAGIEKELFEFYSRDYQENVQEDWFDFVSKGAVREEGAEWD